jgi:hypothetical protein
MVNQVRHRDVQRELSSRFSVACRGSEGTRRFSVQFALELRTAKAVYDTFAPPTYYQIASGFKYDSIGLCVGWRWGAASASILLLRSSQPGTLAITAVETISGATEPTSAPARAPY